MIAEIENKRAEIEALCRRYHVRSLEVFGSAARAEDFDPERSDIDFLVDFDRSTPSDLARKFLGLLVELQDLLGRKVDLVMPNILEDRYLRETIEECREPLYAA